MANRIKIGDLTTLVIQIPARGATDWAADFKDYFADVIADHDHTSGQGARIKNSALVTNTMVADGAGVTNHENVFTAYTSADVAVSTDTIQDNAVTGAKLSSSATVDSDRAVDSNHIKDNAILSRHIALDVLQDIDIAPDSIGTSELKIDAVETENITDLNVTTAKIADANVTAAKIGSDVVLSTLNDVSSTSPSTNDTLEWSGTEWIPTNRVITITTNTVLSTPTSDTTFILTSGADLTIRTTVQRCNVISEDINCELKIESSGRFNHNYVNITGTLNLNSWDVESGTYSEFNYNHGYIGKLSGNQDQTAPATPTNNDTQSNSIFSYNNLIFTDVLENIYVPLGTVQHNKLIFNERGSNSGVMLNLYAEDNSYTNVYWTSSVDNTNYIKFLRGGKLDKGGPGPTVGNWNTPWVLSNDIVTRLNTPISLSAPTSGQVLKWDGTEWAPGTPGVDLITSNTEAGSYTGTSRIIHINASENVTFTSALSDRIIINQSNYAVTFQSDLTNCTIQSGRKIIFENPNSDASTSVYFTYCTVNSNGLEINCSGDQVSNDLYFSHCNINCMSDFTVKQVSYSVYFFEKNNMFVSNRFITEANTDITLTASVIDAKQLYGKIIIPSSDGETTFTAREGSITSSSNLVSIKGATYISGIYPYPFVANADGVKTNVILIADSDASQSVASGGSSTLIYEDEDIDNTGSYDNTTGIFTAKVKGVYNLSASAAINTSELDADEKFYISASVNSGQQTKVGSYSESVITNTQTVVSSSNLSCLVSLDVGDQVKINCFQDSGTSLSLVANPAYNFFNINKIN